MNKIYKLVWSKVRNTWVVASEIAKGHGKNSSSERSGTILKSVILMALLGSFLTAGMPSVSALTQEEEDSIVNAIIQRLETEKKIPHYLSINVPKYEASKLNYNNDAAVNDLYGIAIGAETQTNEEGIAIGRGAKIYKGTEWRDFGTGKLLWPESRQYSMNPLQEVDAEKFRGEYDIHYTRGRNGIAIGTSAQVYEAMGIAIGYNAQASAPDQNSAVAPQVAIGAFAEASGVDAIAIGTGATSRMYGGVSVGYGAFNYGKGYYGIAIGEFSRTEKEGGIALGYRAMAQGDRSLALGWYTRALYSDGVALGNGSVLDRGPTSHAYLDNDWDVKRTIQNQLSPVSIGSSKQTWDTAENKNFPHPPTSKRQLINLAAGTEDSDAVNVAQLKVVDKKVTNLSNNIDTVKPHYFSITASPTAPTSPFSNYHNNGTYNTEHALAIGEGVRAASDYSVALGYEAINQSEWTNEREPDGRPKKVTSYYSMSFLEERLGLSRFHGESAVSMVRGAHSLAIGDRAMTNDTMGIALGYKAITGVRGESNSVAPQIAIGALAEATGWSTVAMGTGATAESNDSIAIGTGAYTKKRDHDDIHSMAFGTYSRTEGTESMSFGHHAKALADRSIAFGAGSEAKVGSGVALGYSSVADRERSLKPYLEGEGKVSETVYGTLGAVSIGNPNEPYEYDNIRVGWSTTKGTRQLINLAAGSADTDAVNVAQLKVVDKKVDHLWSQLNKIKPTKVTVEGKEESQDGNLKIKKTDDNGQLTYDLSLNDEITIGKAGKAGQDGKDGKIGINGKDGRSADITIGKGAAGVDGKNGKDGITRIIYKDEKGDTRQVATLDDGLKFKGDNDTVVTRKLNTQLNITGGISEANLLTQGNIGVTGNADGSMLVQLAKNLKGLSSAEFKEGDKVTNITAQTITQQDGDNITNIKAGDVSVTRKEGDTNKTVNLWELSKTVETNAKATKVTVDGKEESQDGNLKIKKTDDNGQLTYDLSLNDELTIGKDGKDGKIGINGKDGRSAEITVGKGKDGVDGKNGKDGITRIIYKDEKGDTRQVATLDDGLKFKGDNDTVVTRKLNTQLNITGGITNADLVTTGNIGVFGTQDGGLAVQLAKNLKGLSSAEFKDGDKVTNITAQTITQKDGDNITNIKAGDVSVTRKDGDKNKTVNLWDLSKTVETNAKATKVTVDGEENKETGNLKIKKTDTNGQLTYDLSLNDEITIGKKGTPGADGAPGKDGVDGKIGINGKDGRSADITIGKGKAGVDGKDGEAGQAGKDGITRIIYKDEKGDTRQVATLDDGLKFKGDNDTVVTRKLNTQLNITGGAKTDLSENNIGVTGKADGSMLVQLAKNLKGLTSAEFKAGDNVTNITAGDVSVTRKEGNENKTVNLWDLSKKVETNAKATKVTVDGKENKADGNLKIKKTDTNGQLTYDLSLNDEITIGKKGTPGADGAPGKDGVDGKIGINGKDGRSADITIGKGKAGVDGKDGEAGQAGKDGITRIIYKDEKGDTRQVATLDDGLKFKGDDDTVVTRKLNTQLNITGGITNADLVTTGNIGVFGTQDGGLAVQLAKNLKGLSSAEFKDGDKVTNITAQTITQKDGDNITNIKAGDVSVTRKEGNENKTVNLWDLSKKVETNAKATKVTVDGKENKADGNLKIKKTDTNGQLTYDLSLNDEITIGKAGQDGKDGKIGINGKDGRSADITIGQGKDGVDGTNGQDGITRIIYKDEKGDTRQVATLDDGLKFKGDNDTVVTRKLNTQLNITGGAKTDLSENNIGVTGKADGSMLVQLAKNLKGLTSAEFKAGDNVTNITAGDVSVTRKEGNENKTVNLWDLSKKVETNAKATIVKVDGEENKTDGNLKIKKTEKDGQLTYDLTLNNEITLGKKGTPGEDGAPGKDGVDGKIGINGKDGRSADITIGKGAAGVDGKDGEAGQAGKDGITRIIYKDEKGDTRQVATLDDGLKFKGDDDTVVTRKLNTQLNITGGITNADLVTTGNIGVFGTQDGGLAVQLAKNLKGLSSAEFKDGDKVTNITAQTITQKDGDNITNIKAGDVSVTRKDGDTNKTVNLWDLSETVETNAKATKVTVDGKENKADGNLKIKKTDTNGQLTYDLSLNDEITIGKAGQDGKDGKIGINGKDGRSADITIGQGKDGVDGTNGQDGITRIIYKDEKGETRQVATLDDGLKFKGDNDTVVTRKLNTQLNITGGAKTDLSENNIGVTGKADGSMLVQLAKNLKGLTSAEFKAGDNVTNITAGDVSVTRKEGNENKTVNLWDLSKKVETNAKATIVKVDGEENKTDGNLKIKKTEKDGQLTYDLSLNDEITIGKAGQDGKDGKIGLNGKDGTKGEIRVGQGKAGIDGKDGETTTRIIYKDKDGNDHTVATLDDGLKFKGDNDTVVTRKLNTQLDITGGAKTDLSENNIGVTGNADGSMLVQLAKNLTGLSSAEFKDGDKVTNITSQTITQKDGDNITNIKAGDITLTKKEGDTTTTLNLWEFKKAIEDSGKIINPLNFYFGGKKEGNVYTPGGKNWTMPVNEFRMDFGDGLKAEQIEKDGKKYTFVTLDKDSLKNDPAFGGKDGKSAYEVWKDHKDADGTQPNKDKSESDFLDAIKGKDGKPGKNGAAGQPGAKGDKGEPGKTGAKGEQGPKGKDGIDGKNGINGKDGINGKSAYEIWKEKPGNDGKSEQDFLNGLKGDKGDKGADGTNGADGKSAYDIWKEKPGNNGKTEKDFFDSMKGTNGAIVEAGDYVTVTKAPFTDGKGNTYTVKGPDIKTDSNLTIQDIKNGNKKTGYTIGLKEDISVNNVTVKDKITAKTVNADTVNTKTVSASDKVTVGDTVTIDKNGLTIKDGPKDGPSVTTAGINAGGKKVTGVAPGDISKDSNEAVTGGQLFATNQQVVKSMIQMKTLRDESREGDAMGAAMAALKPLDFDPYQRSQVMAGVGYYKGREAVALGLAHYKNEDLMFHGGLAYAGNSELMANVGVSYRFGSSEDRDAQKARNLRLPQYNKGPITSVYILQDEVERLTKENEEAREQIRNADKKVEEVRREANEKIAALEAKLEQVLKNVK